MYEIANGKVIFTTNYRGDFTLDDVDLKTFEILEDKTLTATDLAELTRKYIPYGWKKARYAAKDANSVWSSEVRIGDADAASFEYFFGGQCSWGSDKNRAYCLYTEGKNRIKIINTVGKLRFFNEELGGYMRLHAYDEKYVYYCGRRLKGAISSDCRFLISNSVKSGDLTGIKYNDSFAMVSNGVVYRNGRQIEGSDGDTAEGYSISKPNQGTLYIIVDRNNIYYEGKIFTEEVNRVLYSRIPPVIFGIQKVMQENRQLNKGVD